MKGKLREAAGFGAASILVLWMMLWVSLNTGPWELEGDRLGSPAALRAAAPLVVLGFAVAFLGALVLRTRARLLAQAPAPLLLLAAYAGVGLLAAALTSPAGVSSAYWAAAHLATTLVGVLAYTGMAVGPDRARWSAFLLRATWFATGALFLAFVYVAFTRDDLLGTLAQLATARLYGARPTEVPAFWATANGVGRVSAIVGILAVSRWMIALERKSARGPHVPAFVWGTLAVFAIIMLLATKSRGALAGFAAGLFVLLLLHKGWETFLTTAAIALAGAIFVGASVFDVLSVARSSAPDVLLTGRPVLWREALEMLPQSPFLGFGFQSDRVLLGEHLHNALLQAVFQAGVIGLILFVSAWVLAWRAAFRAGLVHRYRQLGADRVLAAEATAVLAFLTLRGFPESTASFFGIDLLLLVPVFGFLHVMEKSPRVPRERPRRALVCAYACGPPGGGAFGGGEDLLGWRGVEHVSRNYEVDVLVSAEHRPDIEAATAASPLPRVRFVYVDLPRWLHRMRARQGGIQFYAYVWQVRAYFVADALHRSRSYDVYHHLTYANDWMASHAGALLGIPYVRGPGGGAHRVPPAFARPRGWRFRLAQHFRSVMQRALRADPFFKLGQARASAILVCNEEAMANLPVRWARKASYLPVNGVAKEDIGVLPAPRQDQRFLVVSAGKLLSLKAFDVAIRAFARAVRDGIDGRFVILGEGPERPRLEALARVLGVEDRVELPGWRPRDEVLATIASADVFLFTSLRDGGGAVVVEAMALGKPVVCLAIGGPGHHVTPECGFAVAPTEPSRAVRELAAALVTLAGDPDLRKRMGAAASHRARTEYSWERIGERISAEYDDAIAGRERR